LRHHKNSLFHDAGPLAFAYRQLLFIIALTGTA
jgi:hypothetical protein